jgi:hypothetical protein
MCDGCGARVVSYTCGGCRKRRYCKSDDCLQRAWPAHRLECSSCEQEAGGDAEFADALAALGLPFRCVVRQRVGADLHYEHSRDAVGVTFHGVPALVKFNPSQAERAHHAALALAMPARVPLIHAHFAGAVVTQWLTCCLHDNLNLVRTASELAHILGETMAFIRDLAALGLRHGKLDARAIFVEQGRVMFTNFAHVGLLTPADGGEPSPVLRGPNDEIIAFFVRLAAAFSVWLRAGLPLQLQLPDADEPRILSYMCSLVKLDPDVADVLCPETYKPKRARPQEDDERRKRARFQRRADAAAAAAVASPPTIKS